MFSIISMLAALAGQPDSGGGAAPPAPQTLQQQFNAANVAASEGRCSEALAAFDALESRSAISSNVTVLATIRARKTDCLVRLWRLDDAASASRYALTVLNADSATQRPDVAEAHLELGKIAYLRLDYEDAIQELTAADGLQSGSQRIETLMWLARATMFSADDRAISYSEQALKLAAADPAWSTTGLAGLRSLHARALLNHGQQQASFQELQKLLSEKGGLTNKVNLDDLEIRGDLAIAALLTDHSDKAREYLAYTGAGRFKKAQFETGTANNPPPCGGTAGISPDDYAVVEFNLEDDGSVRHVSTIYASRLGPMAEAFARAVAGWSWMPADAQAIPRLFRLVTRVELRCTTVLEHPDALAGLHAVLAAWIKDRNLTPFGGDTRRAAAVDLARAELARRRSAPATLDQVPVLLALGNSPIPAHGERLQWLQQARELVSAAGGPIGGLTWLDIEAYDLDGEAAKRREYLRTLLASPAVAADARTAGTLRLLIAQRSSRLPFSPDARQLLESTIADPALPEHDPLKIASLLQLATLQATGKDFASAQATYQRTGLDSQQCAMFDVKPAIRSLASSFDFPEEATRWGFNGWVMVELDIQADGHTANQRAVISYPALVFTDGAIRAARNTRYEFSYRPDGGLGCGSYQVKVNFRSNSN